MASDPYKTLGVHPSASDEELRSAYRRLVQLHHPDHNQGSPESARRFEEVQEAYAEARRRRGSRSGPGASPDPGARRDPGAGRATPPQPPHDPTVEARLADLERQVREAQDRARREAEKARERARRAAREATARVSGRAAGATQPGRERPTDEELGYYSTDDSFSKIVSDARDELSHRFSDARGHPVVQRVSDLIDGLEDLASKLDRDDPSSKRRR